MPMKVITTIAGLSSALFGGSAQAYVGPGAGLGAIVLTIAIGIGVLLLVVGFLWYPLKRLLKGRRNDSSDTESEG